MPRDVAKPHLPTLDSDEKKFLSVQASFGLSPYIAIYFVFLVGDAW